MPAVVDNNGLIVGSELAFEAEGAGDGTDVTVMVNGFWECPCDELTGADVGVTVTLGVTVGFFDVSGKIDSPFAADRPRTISSSFRRFFSFPTTGSSVG